MRFTPIPVWFLLAAMVTVDACATGDDDPAGSVFHPSNDVMADVDRTLEQARTSSKLALVVVGANWCHDSRGLAARLDKQPLRDLTDEHFERLFVDVGFYEHGFDLLSRFGSPIYYATPTVLIVDPHTEKVLNNGDRHIWANADSLSMQESLTYFASYIDPVKTFESASTVDEVDAYEKLLAQRVRAGYAHVGPMLKAYKEGAPSDDFQERWTELATFRNAIPETIAKLRQQARQQRADGKEIQLTFPYFPPLSWEK